MSVQKRIRVAIVDDSDLVRNGYSLFLEPYDDIELVGFATDGNKAEHLCSETNPDVVLVDLMMPMMNGVVTTRVLKQAFPRVKVIILSGYGDQNLIDEALANGAVKCLNKDISIDGMVKAIREVHLSNITGPESLS